MLGAVACLLIAGQAIGADSDNSEHSQPTLPPSPELQSQLAALRAQAEAAEQRHATPAARAERQASRTAFVGLSRASAFALAKDTFGEVFRTPAFERFQTPAGLAVKRLTETGALLEGATPKDNRLVESLGIPFSSTVGSGERELLDLTLDATASGFTPRNPSVPTTIRSTGGASVDDVNLDVVEAARVPGDESNGRVFYANALRDTDVSITPSVRGVQFGFQVRSVDSPEQIELAIDAPGSVQLQAGQPGMPEEVNVLVDGDAVGAIRRPVAWDADGLEVPVGYDVNDNRLVVNFRHRDRDVRYPLYVDPLYERFGGQYNTYWNTWVPTQKSYTGNGWTFWGTGDAWLGMTNKTGQWFNNWDYARYHWTNPKGYISKLEWASTQHNPLVTCATMGLLNSVSSAWKARWETCSSGWWNPVVDNTDQSYLDRPAMQLWMNGGGARWQAAWLQTYGVRLTRDDREPPTLTSGIPSSAWFTDLNAQGQIVNPTYTISATDRTSGLDGTGVHHFGVFKVNAPTATVGWPTHGCNGTWASYCPGSWSTTVSWGLSEGINNIQVNAYDALNKASVEQNWILRVDRTKPTLTLSGSLFEGKIGPRNTPRIRGNNHKVHITSSDAPSGVANQQVYVDGNPQCPTSGAGCGVNDFDWTYNGATYGAGIHHIEVVVKDQAGLERSQSFDVNWDPTPCPPGT